MALTVATIESRARELYRDTSTTNPGVSQAILIERINDYYHLLYNLFQRRPRSFAHGSGTTNWSAANLAQASRSIDTTAVDLLEILALHREANNTGVLVGPRLERLPVHRILELQRTEASEAAPSRYSLERIGTTTVASMGVWRVRYHPIPDTAYFLSAMTLNEPQTLTTTAQGIDATEEEAWILARLVAADGAMLIGRSREVVNDIRSLVPDRFLRALGRAPEVVPRKRPIEELA